MQETWVRSLGREDPLEKEMATHSSIPAWEIPWTEEPGGLRFIGSQRIGLEFKRVCTKDYAHYIIFLIEKQFPFFFVV